MTLNSTTEVTTHRSALKEQAVVLYALMMHDIKSRFFGNGLGYAVMIAWPLTHIIIILAVNSGRVVPKGSSMVLYAATAVLPWIASNYIARFIMLGVLTNKFYLQYPIIKPLDLLLSRAALEIVSNAIVVVIVLSGMYAMGVDVVPINITDAVLAWLSSIFLGISLGIFGGVVCLAFPLWNLVFVLFIIIAWVTCGMGIDPEVLPAQYGYYFSFNPVLHAVEWMRQAYYLDASTKLLDKSYLLGFSAAFLAIGLCTERLFRSFLLSPR